MIDPKSSNESSLNGFIMERSSIDNLLTSTDESKNIHKQRLLSKFISCSTIHALVMKNLLKLMRNPSVLIMMIFLPIIMVVTFCVAFGNEAHDIPFVIVNDELPYMSDHCPPYNQGCKHLESAFKAMIFNYFNLPIINFILVTYVISLTVNLNKQYFLLHNILKLHFVNTINDNLSRSTKI